MSKKEKLINFIKTQINVELENNINDRLNQKRNILYTKISKNCQCQVLSLLNKYNIRCEEHHKDYFWIWA